MSAMHDVSFETLLDEVRALKETVQAQQVELDSMRNRTSVDAENAPVSRRKLLGIAGAGVAGAAFLGSTGQAAAANGSPVLLGATNTATAQTIVEATNSDVSTNAFVGANLNPLSTGSGVFAYNGGLGDGLTGVVDIGDGAGVRGINDGIGPGVLGDVTDAANNSAAVVANTVSDNAAAVYAETLGGGSAIAAETNEATNSEPTIVGTNIGTGQAVVGSQQTVATVALAGAANGVLGEITKVSNGSHAVKGTTMGAGHSVAGDTPADAEDGSGGPNTTAATWGRHQGVGAGIGGISTNGYGGEFQGGLAALRVIPNAAVPAAAPTTGTHKVGELIPTTTGNLYYCTAEGTPGVFRDIATPSLSFLGGYERAHDSRKAGTKTALAKGEVRKISLVNDTSLLAGITVAFINLTITGTGGGGGHLTLASGDTADAAIPNTSAINWFGDGQTLANGVFVPVGADGTIKVKAANPSHFIVDVLAFA